MQAYVCLSYLFFGYNPNGNPATAPRLLPLFSAAAPICPIGKAVRSADNASAFRQMLVSVLPICWRRSPP